MVFLSLSSDDFGFKQPNILGNVACQADPESKNLTLKP